MVNFPPSFPVLKTPRLLLQPLNGEQMAALTEIVGFNHPNASQKEVLEKLKRSDEYFETRTGITWGIYLRNELTGTVGYYRGFENDIGEIGYVLRPKFRGTGIMEEAVRKAIEFGFTAMELQGICAYTDADNQPSVSLLVKLGFEDSGTEKDGYRRFNLLRKPTTAG